MAFAAALCICDAPSAIGQTGPAANAQNLIPYGEGTYRPLGPDTWPALLDFGELRVLLVLVANVVPRPVAGKVAHYHEGDGASCAEDGDKIRLDILAFGTTKERVKLTCSVSLLVEGRPYQSFKSYTCFNGKVPADGVLMKAGGNPLIYYHSNDPGGNWTVQIDVTEKASGRTARATAGYFKDCQPE